MNRYQELSAAELAEALDSASPPVLVDVRPPAEFEVGRIPGSRNLPVHDLGARRGELPSSLSTRLIVIGSDARRARAGATFLNLIGFGDVSLLAGGIATWEGALQSGPPEPDKPTGPQFRIIPNEE